MFKALIGSIGFFIVAIHAVNGEISLYGLVYKLWTVVFIAWLLGGVLDFAFFSFYDEAIEKLTSGDAG